MSNTQTIPTDRRGNVYYGPRTVAEAREIVARIVADVCPDYPDGERAAADREIDALREQIRAAGYPGVARRI